MMDIPRDAQTRWYELTYLLSPGLTDSELTATRSAIEALVAKHKGEIKQTEDWGKRELSYKIRHGGKRQVEAVYSHLVIEFMPEKAFQFEKELYLQDAVMRHLFVLADAQTQEELEASPNGEAK